MQKSCEHCGKAFEAKLDRARFCSGTCRALHAKGSVAPARVAAEVAAVESSGVDVSARGLVASVRGRVESAGLLGTPDGEAALALAQAMSLPVNQDGSKFASLYAKLTVALDRLDAQAPVATRVDELRLRRDRKRRA